MFFKLSSHDYSTEYTQNKVDQFTYSNSPNAASNKIRSNPPSMLEISLRFLLTLIIIEMLSLAALIPFSLISIIGVGLKPATTLMVAKIKEAQIFIITYIVGFFLNRKNIYWISIILY